MLRISILLASVLCLVFGACSGNQAPVVDSSEPAECSDEGMSESYTRYVEPFVSGSVTSSCSQCHMTGIDISIYAQDTPCQTLACMVDAGAVDLDEPANSSILDQIALGDPNSSVFDVEKEHAAILEWLEWSAICNDEVCGEIESPCSTGTGAVSTGVNPIGDCSEEDLHAVFWDAVIIDRGRCNTCHSQWAEEANTSGTCTDDDDCEGKQECIEGICRKPGPYYAPHFFEGGEGTLSWADEDDHQLGLNTMYNVLALELVDVDSPLDSPLLTKPLLEGFQPEAIYGWDVEMDSVEAGVGVGVNHGGSSKFNFGCREPPCPESGVIDCRTAQACDEDDDCTGQTSCSDGYCRTTDSVCDSTYTNYVRFVQYFAECKEAQ